MELDNLSFFLFLIQSLAWSVVSFVTYRPNWGWRGGTVVMWCAGLFVPRIDACAVSKKTFTYTTRIQRLGGYVNKERDKHYYVYCVRTYYSYKTLNYLFTF